MINRRLNVIAIIFLIIPFVVGLFLIHRATIDKFDLTPLTGIVVSKNMTSVHSFKGGAHYFLVFGIENLSNKIAVTYATERQAKNDSAINLVDIGKTYTFYIDPTYPTAPNQNNGIDLIEYNGVEIYKVSNRANLYAGIFFILLALALYFFITRYKKKENGG